MPRKHFTQAELEAYMEEDLPAEKMSDIEAAIRDEPSLLENMVKLNERRDAGIHSLGAIWRKNRLSCPTREQLGSYLLKTLADKLADYIDFHIRRIGCRVCQANLEDLQRIQQEPAETATGRQRKYFESISGHLHKEQ